jgi:hypothetical protein
VNPSHSKGLKENFATAELKAAGFTASALFKKRVNCLRLTDEGTAAPEPF